MPLLQRHHSLLRRTAVVAPTAVVLLFAALLYDAYDRRRDSTEQVQQVMELVAELQLLQTRLVDAETGQRGFIISGDSAYLGPYDGALKEIRAILARLRSDAAHDAAQASRVEELAAEVNRRFSILEEVLAVRESDGLAAAALAMTAGGGRQSMDLLRAIAAGISEHEHARLASYRSAQARAGRLLLIFLFAGSGAVLAVAVLTNQLFRRELELQEQLNEDLADANRRLQDQAVELEMQTQELQAQALYLEDTTAELESSNEELERQRASLEAMAAERQAANEALQHTNRVLAERTAEAERANRGKTDFLAAMSHELRTPLNAITGYVDLMQLEVYGPSSDGQKQALDRIRTNAGHLLVLINDILHFAKIRAGSIELQSIDVLLDELLTEADAVMVPMVRHRNLTFQAVPPPAPVPVRGDPDRIRQIMLNLLSNAVKYTEDGGRVEVTTEVDGERVSIRVSDTGTGIPLEMIDRIFDPFTQLRRGAGGQLKEGVGLGLSISRELARAMSGELVVESEPGTGSTFTLTLPRGATSQPALAATDPLRRSS
jgi:signal transduction histidine kinase